MADPMTDFGVKRLAYAYTAARAARHYERDYWHAYAAALHGRLLAQLEPAQSVAHDDPTVAAIQTLTATIPDKRHPWSDFLAAPPWIHDQFSRLHPPIAAARALVEYATSDCVEDLLLARWPELRTVAVSADDLADVIPLEPPRDPGWS